jgi:hypothetical protein
MVAGREVSPKDAENTARLMKYWAEGAGAQKIQWNSPGDFRPGNRPKNSTDASLNLVNM